MGRGSSKIGGSSNNSGTSIGTSTVSAAVNNIINGTATLDNLSSLVPFMEIENAVFTTNGNSIKRQNAVVESNGQRIDLTFYSDYQPQQVSTPTKNIETKIEARIWENGNIKAIRTITKTQTKSLKNAKTQYENMYNSWLDFTGQKAISF